MEEERRKFRVAIEQAAVEELRKHMAAEDERNQKTNDWHIGKEVPIALMLAVIAQTIGIVWWASAFAATTNAKFESQDKAQGVAQVVQTSIDKRQDDDARRSEERILAELKDIKQDLKALVERRK